MTDLMQLLLDYAWSDRLPRYLDKSAYDASKSLEDKHLAALRASLPDHCAPILERYREAVEDSRSLELQAMFLAVFSMARELRI